jgi:hypothetical protein
MYGTAQNIGGLAEKQANARSGRLKNSLVKVQTTFFALAATMSGCKAS